MNDHNSKSWTRIDKTLSKFLLLGEEDLCYYYLVRTSGGFSASVANNRIDNFKKDPKDWGARPEVMAYKNAQIQSFAEDICSLLSRRDFENLLQKIDNTALVPIPTHRPKSHPHHDGRLAALCEAVANRNRLTRVEDAFDMKRTVVPSHGGGIRDVGLLKDLMVFEGFRQEPGLVILVDDVLTKGTHYIACRDLIREMYPEMPIIGLFLAIHKSDWVFYEGVTF